MDLSGFNCIDNLNLLLNRYLYPGDIIGHVKNFNTPITNH